MHYSIHTERAYCDWVKRFIHFHHVEQREALFTEPEQKVEEYLTHLAVDAHVSAFTQNQAFNALLFLCAGSHRSSVGTHIAPLQRCRDAARH